MPRMSYVRTPWYSRGQKRREKGWREIRRADKSGEDGREAGRGGGEQQTGEEERTREGKRRETRWQMKRKDRKRRDERRREQQRAAKKKITQEER